MSVSPGHRDFADRLRCLDHICIQEAWVGWFVYGDIQTMNMLSMGPFRTMRDARQWLRSWLPEPRPMHCLDGEPGNWRWFKP